MGRSSPSSSPSSSSPSSSIDSSENPPSPNSPPPSASASASICRSSNFSSGAARRTRRDSSTDLRLSLSISSSTDQVLVLQNIVSPQRENQCWPDWPPIKPLLRSALAGRSAEVGHGPASLFVKVYMEGVPIGRKLDLLSHDGYGDLSERLAHMFKTPILCPNGNGAHSDSDKHYVLTYEDREGDWMMVGDVPWEIFTSTVKRLKITRADRC